MSSEEGDRVQVVGAVDDRPLRRPPGVLLVVAGLVVGLAVGILITLSGTPSGGVDQPPATTTTTVPVAGATTTATISEFRTERYIERIEELETELADAQQQVFELGLETNPTEYAFVVDCEASLRNQFGQDWQANSYFVGPVWFFRLDELSREEAWGGETWAAVFAGVEQGDTVTLVVPASERDNYSLLWNPATWRAAAGYSVASGEPAVTLRACDRYHTAFNGGFVAEKFYCAPLDVFLGDSTEPERIILRLGVTDCPDGSTLLEKPELGPVPDVTGSILRDARLAIRLAALVPEVNDRDPIDPEGMVWSQEPNDGGTYQPQTIVGLRTCQPADHVIATYQERLARTGVALTAAWMAPALNPSLESWYFVSALVSGGPTDGQTATWVLPSYVAPADPINTPNLSIPANEVSQGFDFGFQRATPEDYGVDDWFDLDGAAASQRCVSLSRSR